MASIILLFSTGNVIITFYSCLTLASIIACIVSIFVFLGYEIGITISLAVVIAIGFAVDYVCHLAAHYVHSIEKKRYERATESIRDMGVSIFSGAITTFGSGAFLFGGRGMQFRQLGVTLTLTVSISLIFAVFFFQALCHAIGP